MLRIANDIEVKVSRSEGCRCLGYGTGESPTPRVSALIDSQLEEAHALIKPQVCYTIKDIKGISEPTLYVDDLVFTSHRIVPVLSGCSQIAMFLATIGGNLERKVAQLMKEGLMLEATIMDVIGSLAVEKVADRLEDMIRSMAATNGGRVSWRYSPGYCDWDITQQKELFGGLGTNSIGVNLTSECLMIPRKSISGIMGIGESCITSSACCFCNSKDCPTRREAFIP